METVVDIVEKHDTNRKPRGMTQIRETLALHVALVPCHRPRTNVCHSRVEYVGIYSRSTHITCSNVHS